MIRSSVHIYWGTVQAEKKVSGSWLLQAEQSWVWRPPAERRPRKTLCPTVAPARIVAAVGAVAVGAAAVGAAAEGAAVAAAAAATATITATPAVAVAIAPTAAAAAAAWP